MSNRAQAAVTLVDVRTESQRVQARMMNALEQYEKRAGSYRPQFSPQDWAAEATMYAAVMTALKRR